MWGASRQALGGMCTFTRCAYCVGGKPASPLWNYTFLLGMVPYVHFQLLDKYLLIGMIEDAWSFICSLHDKALSMPTERTIELKQNPILLLCIVPTIIYISSRRTKVKVQAVAVSAALIFDALYSVLCCVGGE